MEATDESKSSTPVGNFTGRLRSISVLEEEEFADRSPKQLAAGRGAETSIMAPPSPRTDIMHPNTSNSSIAVSGGGSGVEALAHPRHPTSHRASLLCSPTYRATSAASQNTANGRTLPPSSMPRAPSASWRRAFSPDASIGTTSGVPFSSSASVSAGGTTAAAAVNGPNASATSTPSAALQQQRPPSLMCRQTPSAMLGSYGFSRSGGGAGASGGVATNVNASNVYTLQLTEDDGGVEMSAAQPLLLEALRLRDAYKGLDKGQLELSGNPGGTSTAAANYGGSGMSTGTYTSGGLGSSPFNQALAPMAPPMNGLTALQQVDGVFYWTEEKTPIVSLLQFTSDVMAVATCVQNPSCLSLANYRLQVLEEKFHLHRLYNADVEENGDRYRRGGGLYSNSCRVDNCVGASTVMNAHWLVEYIRQTVDACGSDIVESADVNMMAGGSGTGGGGGSTPNGNSAVVAPVGDTQTLERVCEMLDFPDPYQLTVEGLGLQPSVNRALPYYDALDPALNGSGRNSAALLRLFLSIRSTSPQKGDYLAGAVLPSLTRNELRTSCPQATEMTLEITGVLAREWEQTAAWVRTHELDSYLTNQFQISFPITKWCGSGGGSGSDGRYAAGATAVTGGPLDSGEDAFIAAQVGMSESAGLYKLSGNGSARGGAPSAMSRNFSLGDVGDSAVPLDAAPGDILTYENYQQLLDHLFLPLFMATLAPEDPKFVDLATLLQHTGAILLSGDEMAKARGGLVGGVSDGGGASSGNAGGGRGRRGGGSGGSHGSPLSDGLDLVDANGFCRRPADVPYTEPVSLTYMCYHMWANLCSLNALRRRRGLNVLQLRVVASNATIPNTSSPHDASLLLLSYLIADVVVDAVALDKQPALQYLYGLNQIGVTMCPMARCSLGTTVLSEHPLARLLWRGLRVSLCTISPLYYHFSQEPLLEEYASAAKCHRLSPTDISELSLHSVCMSSFDEEIKASWVGAAYLREGWRGSVAELTGVSMARLQLRHDSWAVERKLLFGSTPSPSPSSSYTPCAGSPPTGSGGGTELTVGTLRKASRKSSAINSRGREAASTGNNRYSGSAATSDMQSQRRAGSVAGAGAQNASNTAFLKQASPYTVLDPAVNFPRLLLVGPYDRDIAHAPIAQSLHRALDLRQQYCTLPLRPPNEGSIEAATGAEGDKEDVRNSWLANLIHDPQAVLPHPTQSMSWAFKKTSSAAVAGSAGRHHMHFDEDEWKYKTVEGVIVPHEVHQIPRLPQDMYRYEDFCRHVQEIRHLIDHIRVREFARRRLQLLEHRFNLHAAVNHSLELGSTAERASQNRDFYQSTKVDNNIRMETGMTARQLLAFIVDKATHNGDDIVSHPEGKEPQTLRQLLSELHISPSSLTVDDLNIQAGATSSDGGAPHNPFSSEGSQDELLTLLLKTDNQMNGRYFAELTKRTFEEISRDQHTFTESRLPVYGASAGEWGLLSHWFDTHGMSSSHNQWVVQVPRIYSSLRKAGRVASFAEYLEHIFEPLWRISLHPNSDPRLFHFVNHIAAFDCVEDERRPDMPLHRATRAPHEWTSEEEPPYNYYLYHLYANLRSLNRFRQRRRFSVFAFRPSCGEAGSVDHLIGGFLLAQSINYGVRLADSAPLQYLFYLAQVGVTLSPLSNNTKLELNYLNNPFSKFFRRGLRVSLGTDSPLLYHHTQEPLLEEYSIASKIWKLSPNDLSEVARNSVLLSNFSVLFKEEKLGPLYFLSSSAGNDVTRTHLSDVRVAYRFETYHTEMGFLEYISGLHFNKALLTLAMEAQCKQLCGMVGKSHADGTAEGEGEAKKISGRSTWQRERGERSPTSHPSSPRGNDVLIDPTPKEADVKQLEQQRARMQRLLRDLTSSVAELHKQNRLLTTKLGEEKERDQQAAQLRRHRVGDKLRELQVLLDQKQVQSSTSPAAVPSDGSAATAATSRQGPEAPGSGAASNVEAVGRSTHSPPSQPFESSPALLPNSTSQSVIAAAAARSAVLSSGKGGSGNGITNVMVPMEGTVSSSFIAAADAGEQNAATHPSKSSITSALTSHGVVTTVRNRKSMQRDEMITQTRQLLAHSESLWRASPLAAAAASGQQPLPGSAQRPDTMLPPLDAPLHRKR
ncbi:putative adenosine monophosphate deaminase putative AMP deaminase [Leptomonas seymouri]|uniref:Putative adenosine monophosphate deaminase putative AMP deaminase n=1 Tax=Leptomonas seymouri TaxID=5684 RepID=A0A0N1HSA4_LEPSE|nr:putative adenosine monophosphate deaminase putative AMP deaminase [Leptomonas seymouri]|eukprot:KPI83465.1 putative adenosine monophosphate deaminase putative AMP deaminase [Leptomonas seymouri]